ncbi:MAG TPA: tetratricopeptide repeat protein [Nevskia sp.]|nr:tetratricopeptide repeat protein [Nevskia sp.]
MSAPRPSFFAELQRRNVYKVGAMYAVAGWLLVQVVTQVLPVFDVSALGQRILVLIVVAGFPVALVLAWIYELTPQGIVRTDEVAPGASIATHTGQRLNRAIIGVLSLAVLVLLARLLWSPAAAPAATAAAIPAAAPAGDKSIAVLPFDNLSDDKANGYFAVGIQDEILTRLAKIGALKVVSRTSTEQYASHPGNLSDIASKLGVANILEGSVQKAGDAVHINVQLIRAGSDEHLWAETYDRKLDNIFGVEGEVASAIADALKAQLSGEERSQLASKPTQNAEAYDFYLRGLSEYRRVFGVQPLLAASADFAEAVKRDPNFMQAWAYGSASDGLIYFQAIDHSAARLEAARQGAERAMQLAPGSPEAWLARGIFLYRTLDFDGARAALAEALKRQPNNAEALSALAYVERRSGHYEQTIERLRQLAQLDPGNLRDLTGLGETLIAVGQPAAARPWIDKALSLRPGDPSAAILEALSYMYEGNLDAAGRLLDPMPLQLADYYSLTAQAQLREYRHDFSGVASVFQAALSAPDFTLEGLTSQYYPQLAWNQRWAGDESAALATFKDGRQKLRALRERFGDNGYIAASLSLIEAGLGDAQAAEREARLAIELTGKDRFNRASELQNLAQALALCDLRDPAFAALHDAITGPVGISSADLRLSPFWDKLRKDPRFPGLLAQAQAIDQAKAQGQYRL